MLNCVAHGDCVVPLVHPCRCLQEDKTASFDTSVVSASADGTVRVWNAATFECLRVLDSFGGRVLDLKVMGEGQVCGLMCVCVCA